MTVAWSLFSGLLPVRTLGMLTFSRHAVLCPGMTHQVADKAVWTAADRLV